MEAAPRLLGAVLRVRSAEGQVAVRLTEVEAYRGVGVDPGSHTFRGPTARTRSMFGEPGHLYVYLSYGMHVCANVVTHPPGEAGGLLLRAGVVCEGIELARMRRPTARAEAELARGPGRLAACLGLRRDDDGAALVTGGRCSLELPERAQTAAWQRAGRIRTSPRTGVSGAGGGPEFPWRFFLADEPSVSPYRRHQPRVRRVGDGSA